MATSKGHIIAVIRKEGQSEPVGFRLLFKGKNKIVPYAVLYSAMTNSDCVENAELNSGEIVGLNGDLARYGTADIKGRLKKNVLVIVKKFGLLGKSKQVNRIIFQIVDAAGKIELCSYEVAVKYAEEIEMANGKIETDGGTKFVSTISGEYPYEEVQEELFCAAHKITEHVSKLELLQKQLGMRELSKSNTERVLIAAKRIEVSEQFNSGVISILNAHRMPYEIKQTHLDARYGESVRVDLVMYQSKMSREDCYVYQGHALIKLEGNDGYQWHLIDYAQNEYKEILYNASFSYNITEEFLIEKNMTEEELLATVLIDCKTFGESKVQESIEE